MKKRRLIILASALSLYYANTVAAALFQDDFDSATSVNSAAFPGSGDFDPNAPSAGSWYINEDSPEMAQVSSFTGSGQPTAAHSGSNYLIAGFHNEIYGNWNNRGWTTANLSSTVDTAEVDFWVWSHSDLVGIVEGKSSVNAGGSSAFGLYCYTGGEVKFNAGGGLTTMTATLTDDAWNHIVIDLDMVNDTAGVTVNNQATESFAATGAEELASVRFRDDNTGYYDDITISSVPEPATLGLFAFVGVGIFWIRRFTTR